MEKQNVSSYLHNMEKKRYATWIIKPNGTDYLFVDGSRMTEKDLNSKYPTGTKIFMEHERKKYCKGENPDGTSI